jgi:NADH-quinone oxidoreductase subunit K
LISLQHYLLVSAALFSLGILGVLTRKNAVNVLMGIELILNSANINLVAFSRYSSRGIDGQLFAIFVIVVAASEVVSAPQDRQPRSSRCFEAIDLKDSFGILRR